MANTTNLNLEKPIGTDQALVSVINSNMDKIDTFAGSTNQAFANLGRIETASGTYTTAVWTYGTNTCVLNVTKPGLYIVWMFYELADSNASNRSTYKQLQIQTNGTRPFGSDVYLYDAAASSPFVSRTISGPIQITQAGQYIRPYVHTGTADIVYNVKILAMQIK